MTTELPPILYSFRRCPYAMRARLSLFARGIACCIREVQLKNKPQEMLDLSPKGTVPVMHLPDASVIDESLDIMIWAMQQETCHPNISSILYPSEEMLALIQTIDGPFKHNLDRYKYENRYEGAVAKEHRNQNIETLEHLNGLLISNQYLFGDEISFADIAIAPFVRQFANTDKTWFHETSFTALITWLDRFCNSGLFEAVMTKYIPWKNEDDAIYLETK